MSYQTGIIECTFPNFDGESAEGNYEIIPSARIVRDQAGNQILSGRIKGSLSGGLLHVEVPASDDTSLDPTDVTYTVSVRLRSTNLPAIQGVFVPHGQTVQLAEWVSVNPTAPSYQTWVNQAATAAGQAATSAGAAAGSATAASGSATAASTSAGNAASSATAAGTSATNAAGSATNAAGSATAAATSATNAASAATAAVAATLPKVAATVSASGAAAINRHNPVDATAAARTISLPTGQPEGTQVSVEKVDASANTVTVTGSIRGNASSSVSLVWQYETIVLRADGAGSWWPYAGHKTKASLDTTYGAAALSATFARKRRGRVGFIGDSITAAGGGYTGGNATFLANQPAVYAMFASDGRWDLVNIAGVAGQRSDQILARVQSEIIAAGCTVCVIQSCYMNDVGQGLTVAQNLANITAMVNLCLTANVLPVIILPTPDGQTGSTTARRTWLAQATQQVRNYGQANGIPVVDPGNLHDPATGLMAAAYNADGSVHPNSAGYAAMGLPIGAALDALLPPSSNNLIKHVADSTDLLGGKGLFLTSSGGVGTGFGLAGGSSGGTPSITTDAQVVGNLQRLTAAAMAGNLLYDMPITGYTVGNVLELRGIVTSSGGTALPRLRLVLGGAPNPNVYLNLEPKGVVTRGKWRMAYPVPSGTTSISLRMQLQAGDGYFEIGQVSARDLTALGLAA